jgi:hypothetical protein
LRWRKVPQLESWARYGPTSFYIHIKTVGLFVNTDNC